MSSGCDLDLGHTGDERHRAADDHQRDRGRPAEPSDDTGHRDRGDDEEHDPRDGSDRVHSASIEPEPRRARRKGGSTRLPPLSG